MVVPGHEIPDVETVVHDRGVYVVLRKQGHEAEQLAVETDPRT